MTTAKNKVFIELLKLLFSGGFIGGDELFVWDKNLVRRKSNGGRIFASGGDEQILGWWGGVGTPPSRENPITPYIKAKKKSYFENFKN